MTHTWQQLAYKHGLSAELPSHVFNPDKQVFYSQYLEVLRHSGRPVAGGGAGRARAPPGIFRLELNSATKVEFFY